MAKHAMTDVEGFVGRKEYYMFDPRNIIVEEGWNDRKDFSGHDEMKQSIIENGVQEPMLCKKNKDGDVVLRNGERRLRATLDAIKDGHEIKAVPVILMGRNVSDVEALAMAFRSNDGKPFTAVEEAAGYRRLKNWGLTPKEIAAKVGKSLPHVYTRLELDLAVPEVKEAVTNGEVTIGAAVNAIKESDGDVEEQKKIARKPVAKMLSRKTIEQIIKDYSEVKFDDETEEVENRGYLRAMQEVLDGPKKD